MRRNGEYWLFYRSLYSQVIFGCCAIEFWPFPFVDFLRNRSIFPTLLSSSRSSPPKIESLPSGQSAFITGKGWFCFVCKLQMVYHLVKLCNWRGVFLAPSFCTCICILFSRCSLSLCLTCVQRGFGGMERVFRLPSALQSRPGNDGLYRMPMPTFVDLRRPSRGRWLRHRRLRSPFLHLHRHNIGNKTSRSTCLGDFMTCR